MLKNILTSRDQQTAKQPRQPQGSATIMIIYGEVTIRKLIDQGEEEEEKISFRICLKLKLLPKGCPFKI